MQNFTPIRNGLLDHIRDGKLCPFDLGIYVFLHLRADWSTGIYHGCALTIAHQFADASLKHHINKSLIRLRERRYVNYRKGDGRRGGYPILIHKYHVTVGELSGMRLNAWKHGELAKPEHEVWNGHGRVEEESGKSGERVGEPILDFKTLLDVKDVKIKSKSFASPESSAATKKGTRIPEDFAVTSAHRAFAIKNGLPSPDVEVEKFKDHFRAAAWRNAVKKDWDAAFRNWLRKAAELCNHHGNGGQNGKPSIGEVIEREQGILRSRRAPQ